MCPSDGTYIDRPHPGDLSRLAFELINARGADYDNAADIEQNFREAAAVASVVIGKDLNARDVAMVLALRQADPVQKLPGQARQLRGRMQLPRLCGVFPRACADTATWELRPRRKWLN